MNKDKVRARFEAGKSSVELKSVIWNDCDEAYYPAKKISFAMWLLSSFQATFISTG